jgi:hypothetical protein
MLPAVLVVEWRLWWPAPAAPPRQPAMQRTPQAPHPLAAALPEMPMAGGGLQHAAHTYCHGGFMGE